MQVGSSLIVLPLGEHGLMSHMTMCMGKLGDGLLGTLLDGRWVSGDMKADLIT